MKKGNQYKIFSRIEFWLLIFFLVRMIGITNPPLETGHNWRQATGLMVARNFLETNSNIFYPRIDDNKGESGIIGMEFPLMNYAYYGSAKLFGYTHWYGRLINLIISTLGLFFYFKIIGKYFSSKIAITATLILTTSIWFAFSRKMMPDTFSVSLMFIGFYYGTEYLNKIKWRYLILFVLFTSFGILAKIPAGIFLVLLIPIVLKSKIIFPKIMLSISTLIPLSLTYWWYFIWNPHLSTLSGTWYNVGQSLSVGMQELIENIDLVAQRFYFDAFYSFTFFAFFIVGLFLMFKKKEQTLIYSFILLSIMFLIYMIKSGYFFYHHNYYIIPFVPIMALTVAYALSYIKKTWLFIAILSIGITESIANQQHDFFIKQSEFYKLQLESIADSISEPQDLIAINSAENPQQIYLTHRKGWTCNNEQLQDSVFIQSIKEKGCKYIFVNKHSYKNKLNYSTIYSSYDFDIYLIVQ